MITLTYEKLIMEKLMIGKKIMPKPTITKVILENFMIIKLIMVKPTKTSK